MLTKIGTQKHQRNTFYSTFKIHKGYISQEKGFVLPSHAVVRFEKATTKTPQIFACPESLLCEMVYSAKAVLERAGLFLHIALLRKLLNWPLS